MNLNAGPFATAIDAKVLAQKALAATILAADDGDYQGAASCAAEAAVAAGIAREMASLSIFGIAAAEVAEDASAAATEAEVVVNALAERCRP